MFKRLIKKVKGIFVKKASTPIEKHLSNLAAVSSGAVNVFTTVVNSLKRSNEQLSSVRSQALDKVDYYVGISDQAYKQIASNEKVIDKITKIIE